MTSPLRIGIAGLGTVGSGVARLLAANAAPIAARAGRRIELRAVLERDRSRARGLKLGRAKWHRDPREFAADPNIDVVVELIGGAGGIALDLVKAALAAGKHVVTANKAMLAHHGNDLALRASRSRRALAFEAAVAGGIPILKALREGLAANKVERVYGILNGTCNYILTQMRDTGRDFGDVLKEAQKLGYAERDPRFDIDGVDTAHKLALLAAVAYGGAVDFKSIHVEGIRHVSALDIEFARELGYEIKLLGVARLTPHGLEQRVHPCMVPRSAPIAHVEGVFNAVVVEGDFVGRVMLEGRGAGSAPTASAVVADLMDIAAGRVAPGLRVPAARLKPAPMARHAGAYYLRLMVVDRPGVIAAIAASLRDQKVSMAQMIQRGRSPDKTVPVVITTHETEESSMRRALDAIARLKTVREKPRLIRVEAL